jgi:hypothetical protein
MATVQLGVDIPFGCQIGAKDAQCAFDARKAVSTWDGNSAFYTEPRQDTFSGVSDRAPRLLLPCMGLWTPNTPAVPRSVGGMECDGCATKRSSWPIAGTYPLICSSIRDAVDRMVVSDCFSPHAFLHRVVSNLR